MPTARPIDPRTIKVRNPREAAQAFHQVPKQRNVFLVRFHPNGQQVGADIETLGKMTYIAKSVDRPKVNPKTEELHQYNKKRQVYTGFKLEPVRVQFYDSADGSAFKMWQQYSAYYFGDFVNGQDSRYSYDVIGKEFMGGTQSFGFTANAVDGEGQFFFKSIEILHFNNTQADIYRLTNPRITMFEPDDLDYENSGISMISMALVYENLQYFTYPYSSVDLPEFDGTFRGDVPHFPGPVVNPTSGFSNDVASSSSPVTGLFTSVLGIMSKVADYRYNNVSPGSALSAFGQFAFGPAGTTALSLAAMSNPLLAAAMDIGSKPLAILGRSLQSTVNTMTNRSISGAVYDSAMGQASAVTSGYGNATSTLAKAMVADTAGGSVQSASGITLGPQSYGAINASQTGTAQYGYNPGSHWVLGAPMLNPTQY